MSIDVGCRRSSGWRARGNRGHRPVHVGIDDKLNWSPQSVPVATSDVVIAPVAATSIIAATVASLHLAGAYTSANFNLTTDNHGGTLIHYA
jgi:hypothetical protein